jgi:peptidoglycan/LPS O-acetylase OafA/YrhL
MTIVQPINSRIDALTGLRFLAALAVYLHHHPKPAYLPDGLTVFFSAGYNGVTLFFVLSGFVLGINYFDALVRPSWRAILKYFSARMARVYPLYLLVLFFVWWNRGAPQTGNALVHFMALQSWSPDLLVAYGFNEPGWSIGVEFFLYAGLPFLVLFLAPLRRNSKWLWSLAGGVMLTLIALAVYFELSGRGILPIQNPDSAHRWLYRTPLTRLGDFTLGVIAALLFQISGRASARVERGWAILGYAAFAGIIFLMALPAHLNSVFSWDASYAPLVFFLLLGLARAPQTRLARCLAARPLIILGEASFALYLIHSPLMHTFDIARFTDADPWVAIPAWTLFGAACIILSIGLNMGIETPLRRALNVWMDRVLALTQTPAGRERVALTAITVLAILLGYIFFIVGRQDLFWDAKIYAQLGKQIAADGLFQFSDATRAYGYPLFLAGIWRVSEFVPLAFQLLVFNAQLAWYLLVCHFAFRVFRRVFAHRELALGLFALIALNPFLLIYTGVALSDLLSASLIFCAFLFSIIPTLKDATPSHRARAMLGAFAFFAVGFATMMRPANLIIGIAVAGIWFLRERLDSPRPGRAILWMLLGLILPFVPQLHNNYRAYAQLQPLIVRSLYSEQLEWGMHYLKYVSIVLPENAWGVAYLNPFWSPEITSFADFFRRMPSEFFLTQAIHLFALFDFDHAFPYVTDLNAWYRAPLAFWNLLFLFGALSGVLIWLARSARPRWLNPFNLAFAGMLMGVAVYLPAHLVIAVEPRFSLPMYLMLSPFCVYALWQIHLWRSAKRWRMIALQACGLGIFLAANLLIADWFQTQVPQMPLLGLADSKPGAINLRALNAVQIQFEPALMLTEYGINRAEKIQGGDMVYLVFKWMCAIESPASYDSQIKLVDSKNRIWAERMPSLRQDGIACGDPARRTNRITDFALVPLPIAMPAGEYRVVVEMYDRANDRYLSAREISGARLDEHLPLVTLVIEKNKSSITASQLFLKNPFFVDMQEMRLLGYADLPDQVRAGDVLDVGLYWRARGKPQGDYSITVQLRDAAGNVVVEQTARPAENTYPTTEWNEGEVLMDWHTLDLPSNLVEGEYSLVAILRDAGRDKLIGEAQFTKISVAR